MRPRGEVRPPAARSDKRPLKFPGAYDILVRMTRNAKSTRAKPTRPRRRARRPKSGQWPLQDAKARFSELVRRVRSEGPQRVTVHGRDEVVVISAEEFRRLKGDLTGEALIAAMQASPHRDIDIKPRRAAMPVREVLFGAVGFSIPTFSPNCAAASRNARSSHS